MTWKDFNDAWKRGQIPIPGTVGPRHDKHEVNVKDGDPVFYGMTGAGCNSDFPWMVGLKDRYIPYGFLGFKRPKRSSFMNPENTKLMKWYDREGSVKEIGDFHRSHPKSPIFLFGHSYGGPAAVDVANSLPKGSVEGVAVYDPVAHNPSALENAVGISSYPKYKNNWAPWNIIARIGGRIPEYNGMVNETSGSGDHHMTSADDINANLGQLYGRYLLSRKRQEKERKPAVTNYTPTMPGSSWMDFIGK